MTDLCSVAADGDTDSQAEPLRLQSCAVISMLLGALIIYGAGFAPGILHGASHDSRHTLGFVCH